MKHKISETGARMLKYQEQLADEYKYKPIPRTFFKDVRAEVEEALPEWCNMSGDTTKLETRSGTVIASGYNRIVIGDYGAFVEFSRAQANARHLKIKEGQSYRIEDPRYAEHVKYLWLTADDDSDVKVYDQKRSVEYADYKPGMLYVSVYEVFPAETDAGFIMTSTVLSTASQSSVHSGCVFLGRTNHRGRKIPLPTCTRKVALWFPW